MVVPYSIKGTLPKSELCEIKNKNKNEPSKV